MIFFHWILYVVAFFSIFDQNVNLKWFLFTWCHQFFTATHICTRFSSTLCGALACYRHDACLYALFIHRRICVSVCRLALFCLVSGQCSSACLTNTERYRMCINADERVCVYVCMCLSVRFSCRNKCADAVYNEFEKNSPFCCVNCYATPLMCVTVQQTMETHPYHRWHFWCHSFDISVVVIRLDSFKKMTI